MDVADLRGLDGLGLVCAQGVFLDHALLPSSRSLP
jgi:hypothetical protein